MSNHYAWKLSEKWTYQGVKVRNNLFVAPVAKNLNFVIINDPQEEVHGISSAHGSGAGVFG